MIWAYVENVNTWFSPSLYIKYGNVFENVWAASAYKGASGELTAITSVNHHYLNHITWVEVIHEKMSANIVKFRGIALTGWSRYDHFLAVCDLLPEAIPSLVYNLETVIYGKIDGDRRGKINDQLGCSPMIPWSVEEIYDGFIRCKFPGHSVYEAILPLKMAIRSLATNMEFAEKYMSPMNLNYNYIHKARGQEVIDKLSYDYYSLYTIREKFISAAQEIYWNDTINEWLDVYLLPHLDKVYNLMSKIRQLMKENDWKPRPLPISQKQYPKTV
jgi:hexosaminidase